jgi:hypothetical protein
MRKLSGQNDGSWQKNYERPKSTSWYLDLFFLVIFNFIFIYNYVYNCLYFIITIYNLPTFYRQLQNV